MTTLTIDNKYVEALRGLGTLDEVVEQAVHQYAVTHIQQRIERYRHAVQPFEAKYGLTYEQFTERILHDEPFVERLWQQDPAWRTDLTEWEYYAEGLAEWHGRLKNISHNS